MRMNTLVGVVGFLTAVSAGAISPPQYELQRKLAASVGACPFVKVGEVREIAGENVIDIVVSEEPIARGLGFILKRDYNFGGIKVTVQVLDGQGAIVAVDDAALPGQDPIDTTRSHFLAALLHNPLVVGLGPRPMLVGDFSIDVKPEVLQFWNDNLADPRGLSNLVAATTFQDVVRPDFIGGKVRMLFGTAPVGDSPGHLEGYVLAAASAPGRFGSVWSTDLWVYSTRATAINLWFLPADSDNSVLGPGVALPLDHGVLKLADVVATVFHATGAGSIRYAADGPVRVVSRTWTPTSNGGSCGETALGIPATAVTRATCSRPRLLMLVDQRTGARANLALLNASPAPARVAVEILTSDGLPAPGSTPLEVELSPFGCRQIRDILQHLTPAGHQGLRVQARLVSSGGALLGCLSEVDNTTNDSSYQEAFGCQSP